MQILQSRAGVEWSLMYQTSNWKVTGLKPITVEPSRKPANKKSHYIRDSVA